MNAQQTRLAKLIALLLTTGLSTELYGFGYSSATTVTFEIQSITLQRVEGTSAAGGDAQEDTSLFIDLLDAASEHTFTSAGADSFVPARFADFEVPVGRYEKMRICLGQEQKIILDGADFRGPNWAGHVVQDTDKLYTTGVGQEVSSIEPEDGAAEVTIGESGQGCETLPFTPILCISETGDECESGDNQVSRPDLYLLANLNYAVNINAGLDGNYNGEEARPGRIASYGGRLIPTIGQPGAVVVLTQNSYLIGPTPEIGMIALIFSPTGQLLAVDGRHSGDIPGFCGSNPIVGYDDETWVNTSEYDRQTGQVRWMTRVQENLGHGVMTIENIHQAVGETTAVSCLPQDEVEPAFLGHPAFEPVGKGTYLNHATEDDERYSTGPMDWIIYKIVDPGKSLFSTSCPSGFCQADSPRPEVE